MVKQKRWELDDFRPWKEELLHAIRHKREVIYQNTRQPQPFFPPKANVKQLCASCGKPGGKAGVSLLAKRPSLWTRMGPEWPEWGTRMTRMARMGHQNDQNGMTRMGQRTITRWPFWPEWAPEWAVLVVSEIFFPGPSAHVGGCNRVLLGPRHPHNLLRSSRQVVGEI